jgi:archaellum component FlaF (FlaF/FlaG flagellin family)
VKALTPNEYAQVVWGGTVTSKTVINWINSGKQLKNVSRVEITPTGRYVLFMEEQQNSNVQNLVEMLKSKAA